MKEKKNKQRKAQEVDGQKVKLTMQTKCLLFFIIQMAYYLAQTKKLIFKTQPCPCPYYDINLMFTVDVPTSI